MRERGSGRLAEYSLSPALPLSPSPPLPLPTLPLSSNGRAFDPPIEVMNLTTDRFELIVVMGGEGLITLLLQFLDL